MRRFYPLPADEPSLWPNADDISNTPGAYRLGRRVLDSGLNITWGGTPSYWNQIDDPTSPRGRVWRLKTVCWLAIKGKVTAPRPGLYAAFYRVRQTVREDPLLKFSAEWKVSAKHASDVGFVRRSERSRTRPVLNRQESEAEASWTHWRSYDEENPGGWLLCHVGNILVGDVSDEAQQPRQHQQQQQERGAGGGSDEGTQIRGDEKATEILVSFGGENAWCGNLEVDFAAIAPIRLSWEVERVLMVGHRKGYSRRLATPASTSGTEPRLHHEEEIPAAAAASSDDTAGQEDGSASPLSLLPDAVLLLVFEFSQPTLVRPRVENEPDGQGDDAGAKENEGDSSTSNAGAWEVF